MTSKTRFCLIGSCIDKQLSNRLWVGAFHPWPTLTAILLCFKATHPLSSLQQQAPLISTSCIGKRHGLQPFQSPKHAWHPPLFSGAIQIPRLLSVNTVGYLHMVIAQSVSEIMLMNAACDLCWLRKAWVEWLLLWIRERAEGWCRVWGQSGIVRNQIHRNAVHNHTCSAWYTAGSAL